MTCSRKASVCAIVTVHNRRERTLAALEGFFQQEGDFSLRCVLMDDGSSDGTSEAVRKAFPQVTILRGDGSLYWNRGMAQAFARAVKLGFDYYLWLNDDTFLFPSAVQDMARVIAEHRPGVLPIVVGTTRDPMSGIPTYGGRIRASRWHPGRFRLMTPSGVLQKCDAMNGNVVLISHENAVRVGGIDTSFSHSFGDLDYGLRARALGIPLLVPNGYQGECARNPAVSGWRSGPTILARLEKVMSPKGLPPREWAYFLRKHGSALWPIAWILTYRGVFKRDGE